MIEHYYGEDVTVTLNGKEITNEPSSEREDPWSGVVAISPHPLVRRIKEKLDELKKQRAQTKREQRAKAQRKTKGEAKAKAARAARKQSR